MAFFWGSSPKTNLLYSSFSNKLLLLALAKSQVSLRIEGDGDFTKVQSLGCGGQIHLQFFIHMEPIQSLQYLQAESSRDRSTAMRGRNITNFTKSSAMTLAISIRSSSGAIQARNVQEGQQVPIPTKAEVRCSCNLINLPRSITHHLGHPGSDQKASYCRTPISETGADGCRTLPFYKFEPK